MNDNMTDSHGHMTPSETMQFEADRAWQLRVEGPFPVFHPAVIAHALLMSLSFILLQPLVAIAGKKRWAIHPLLGVLSLVILPILGLLSLWSSKGSFVIVSQTSTPHRILGWVMLLLAWTQCAIGVYRNLSLWRVSGGWNQRSLRTWDRWNPILLLGGSGASSSETSIWKNILGYSVGSKGRSEPVAEDELGPPNGLASEPAGRHNRRTLLVRIHSALAPILILLGPPQIILGLIGAIRFCYWWHVVSSFGYYFVVVLPRCSSAWYHRVRASPTLSREKS